MNPLELSNVLSTVIENVENAEDLKTVGLVNRLWRDESFPHWRANAVFVVTPETLDVLSKVYNCKSDDKAVEDPFRLVDAPFKSFRVRYQYPSLRRSKSYSRRFEILVLPPYQPRSFLWDKCLFQAKYLDLGSCLMETENKYLQGFIWLFKNCPDLKELKISPYRLDSDYERRRARYGWNDEVLEELEMLQHGLESLTLSVPAEYPGTPSETPLFHKGDIVKGTDFGRKLFKMLPKLKHLTVALNQETKSILSALINPDGVEAGLVEKESLIQLESLSLPSQLPLNQLNVVPVQVQRYLKVAQPPLKYLEIGIEWVYCVKRNAVGSLFKILKGCESTLKGLTLQIYFGSSDELVLDLDGLNFPNLTQLQIAQNGFSTPILFNFCAMRKMPRLQVFHLTSDKGIAFYDEIKPQDLIKAGNLDELEEFSLPEITEMKFFGYFNKEALEQIGKWMGNLKVLETVLDRRNYEDVFMIWPELEKVTKLSFKQVKSEIVISEVEKEA